MDFSNGLIGVWSTQKESPSPTLGRNDRSGSSGIRREPGGRGGIPNENPAGAGGARGYGSQAREQRTARIQARRRLHISCHLRAEAFPYPVRSAER